MVAIAPRRAFLTAEERKVLIGSSIGTLFEWYDFMVYGSLAGVIAKNFFSGVSPIYAYIFALLGFAAGFLVRPLGAVVFGRLGDMIGRKRTFLMTIIVMGIATVATGLLPTYRTAGVIAPVALLAMRMLQGLALGGEYGGAATYVAEFAPEGRRGFFTSWIQTTGTVGMLISLLVVFTCIKATGSAFNDWGWRIPFLLSAVLLAISLYIRMSLQESPVFERMKSHGRTSKAPLREAFGHWKNIKVILLVLFGICAGQTVLYYCSAFFPVFFLTQILKVETGTANLMCFTALTIGIPFFVLFGWLSDRIGRKPVLLAGLILPAATLFPIYKGLTHFVNPALVTAQAASPVTLHADPANCSVIFNPTGAKKFTSPCDVAKLALSRSGVNYRTVDEPAGSPASVSVGTHQIPSFDAAGLAPADEKTRVAALDASLSGALKAVGYPATAPVDQMNIPGAMVLLIILAIYAATAYSVMGAMMVEMFPARIRYTSLSVPYHVATGWFGGLQPTISFALIAQSGNIYQGFWYPIITAIFTIVICVLFIRETKDNPIDG